LTQSLEDKIGQMLVFGWSGPDAASLNAHARHLIEELRIGGLILMGRNVAPLEVTRGVTSEAQRLAAACGLPPLLICVDQEGGRVARFGPPHYPPFPSARTVGQSGDLKVARNNAAVIGNTIKEAGINWALMPVLDVNNNPGNEVIGDRSYGDDPGVVSAMGVATIQGMQDDAGLMACGKHFPGHGDTAVDSHLALPIIDHPLERLQNVELPPFRAAIDAGVGAIMTSHILFPALDADLPASLSPIIVQGLLRGELGYDGIVITDCLEMQGVAAKWGTVEAAVLAVIAGADMVLICHTEAVQRKVQQALVQAVLSGRISELRLDEANRRIGRAKSRFLLRMQAV
jgi:beta-N-acetylhexosaminidase